METKIKITRESGEVICVSVCINTGDISESTSITNKGVISKPFLSNNYLGYLTKPEVVLLRKAILKQLKKELGL
jgi:hypothetical protein